MAASFNHHCFLFFFFFIFRLSDAQIPQNLPLIRLGSSITAGTNDSWLSPSGDFAFGFYEVSVGLYVAGIWFDRISDRTLVWSANRDDPATTGSTIRLTFDGQLVLTYNNNSSPQFIYQGAAVSLGFMHDNGNFVLRDSSSRPLWQSFDFPTNTILPGQVVIADRSLISNENGTSNYSTGNFMLQMQFDGNLVLSAYRYSDPGYWFAGTLTNNVSLVFNESSAYLYLVNGTGDIIQTLNGDIPNPTEDFYHRAIIDDFGNFQQFVYPRRNGSVWQRVWRALTEPCLANSVCGAYGFCSSNDNETVSCNCLPGYIPLDPNMPSRGCRPEIVVNYCNNLEMRNFTVEVIENADLPLEGFADLARVLNVDVEGCKKALMEDCYSMAAALRDSTCNKKRMPLLNARISASTLGRAALIKVAMRLDDNASSPNGNRKKKSNTRGKLKGSLYATSILAFLFGLLAFYYHPATKKLVSRKPAIDKNAIGINFREFTYQEMRDATNEFSKTLGRGSSGKVYGGSLRLKDAEIEIAVKKLEKVSETGEREFMTELKIIGRTHHKNLVKLLGFCIEDDQRLIVYELMKNGTLSGYLFKDPSERPSWTERSEMAIGIAKGLLYLHEECETQIIHCDIKPQNVLIDDNYKAKISDFGLSKLLYNDATRTHTRARGTMGYMAPEWLRNAPITTMVDVYSFGVMLLEICIARRHIELNRVEEESEADDLHLIDWVLMCMRDGTLEVVARHDAEVLSDFKRFERMVKVGVWCVHLDPFLRPTMKKITQMLEGTMEVGIPPLVYQD